MSFSTSFRRRTVGCLAFASLLLCSAAVSQAAFSNAFLLSDSGDWAGGANAMKTPKICSAAGGGFHSSWIIGNTLVRYRRVPAGGTLNTMCNVPIVAGHQTYNQNVLERSGGRVVACWEDWTPGVGAEIRVSGSNDYVTWGSGLLISSSGNFAKWPQQMLFPSPLNNASLVTYWNSSNKDLRYSYIIDNAPGWTADTYTGWDADNQYGVTGIAYNTADNSSIKVFTTKTGSLYNICTIRCDPTTHTWGNFTTVAANLSYMPSRLWCRYSINGCGLIVFDSKNSTSFCRYVPATGWAAPVQIEAKSFFGECVAQVTGVATDTFRVFNCSNQNIIKMWTVSGGAVSASTSIGTNLPTSFIPNVTACRDVSNNYYVAWEYWDTAGNNPQVYYSYGTP